MGPKPSNVSLGGPAGVLALGDSDVAVGEASGVDDRGALDAGDGALLEDVPGVEVPGVEVPGVEAAGVVPPVEVQAETSRSATARAGTRGEVMGLSLLRAELVRAPA